jgi:Mg-chelatase subunit ChlD
MSWAVRRRIIYGAIFILVVAAILAYPIYSIFHQPASCTDGRQDQGEQGVDCGGPCAKLCTALEAPPVTLWQQVFTVEPGIYTAVAYLENPNKNASASAVPFEFDLYDASGTLLLKQNGTTDIPAGKNFAVIAPGVTSSTTIASAAFSLGNFNWYRPQNSTPLVVSNIVFSTTTTPIVEATIGNPSYTAVGRTNVVAIVYNDAGNAVAASETYIGSVDANSSGQAVFTWPRAFPVVSTACAAPADVMIALDRSGSMASDGRNPEQPLTDVKTAAANFVSDLSSADKVGLVSFATTPSDPLDMPLTTDFSGLKSAIGNITIHTGGTQYTDIADTIATATAELVGAGDLGVKKAIVLLTDGIPTQPVKAGDPNYPATVASGAAQAAINQGINIFTIGLGTDVNATFLRSLASAPDDYYTATTSKSLIGIYNAVSSSICQKQPVRVEILTDTPND